MSEKTAPIAPPSATVPVFGTPQADSTYVERRATYAVMLDADNRVAVVRGMAGRLWLPGGGSLPDESAAQTVIREVSEELARDVRPTGTIGEAIEFFYAPYDGRHYRMSAAFLLAELGEKQPAKAEFELCWLPIAEASSEFFHRSHAWAVGRVTA